MLTTKKRQPGKRYEELTFSDDFMFCKILQNDPELCRELLELILGRKVTEVLHVEQQKPIEITADAKGVRFDVYLDDDRDNVYLIEMQTTRKKNLPKRIRYYQGMLDLNQIERGAEYEELKKSCIIFICLDNPFPKKGRHLYTFKNVCLEDPELLLPDETVKIILSAQGHMKDVSKEMEAFLQYLITHKAASDLTARIENAVETARQHKRWRGEYMTLYEKYREYLEEGREEGREIGREEGRILGTIETLTEMGLEEKAIIETIVSKWGLSLETAEKYLLEAKGE